MKFLRNSIDEVLGCGASADTNAIARLDVLFAGIISGALLSRLNTAQRNAVVFAVNSTVGGHCAMF